MRAAFALILVALSIAQAAYITGGGCSSSAAITRREKDGMWLDSKRRINAVYELTVTNTGVCPARYVGVTVVYPSGYEVAQTWNIDMETPAYALIQGFGEFLQVGTTYNGAGFVLAKNITAKAPVTATIYGTACDSACITANGGPDSNPFSADVAAWSAPAPATQ